MAWLIGDRHVAGAARRRSRAFYNETPEPVRRLANLAIGAAVRLRALVDDPAAPIATASASRRSSSRSWRSTAWSSSCSTPRAAARSPSTAGRPIGDHATLEFMVAAVGISMAMLRTPPHAGSCGWPAIAVGTASSFWHSAGMPGSSWPRCSRAFIALLGGQPAAVRRVDRGGRGRRPRDHRADLVVARLGRAIRQPRSHRRPEPRQRLRDDQPGPHQRHPGRLRPGAARTPSPGSAWASSTTGSARRRGRATPGWCTTPRSRSGSSSGSSA